MTRLACGLFVGLLLAGSTARTHGIDRAYGGGPGEAVSQRASPGASPAFTLLLIESVARGMRSEIDAGRAADARRETARLTGLVEQLRRGLAALDEPRGDADAVGLAVQAGARRVAAAADDPSMRRELLALERLAASAQRDLIAAGDG